MMNILKSNRKELVQHFKLFTQKYVKSEPANIHTSTLYQSKQLSHLYFSIRDNLQSCKFINEWMNTSFDFLRKTVTSSLFKIMFQTTHTKIKNGYFPVWYSASLPSPISPRVLSVSGLQQEDPDRKNYSRIQAENLQFNRNLIEFLKGWMIYEI